MQQCDQCLSPPPSATPAGRRRRVPPQISAASPQINPHRAQKSGRTPAKPKLKPTQRPPTPTPPASDRSTPARG
eukprot:10467471-Alexandrium_andersonii.AAC.1